MRRSWFGAGLLLLLLVLGLLTAWAMAAIHEPTGQLLEQAGVAALQENWQQAEARFQEARESWEAWSHFRSCFADHAPAEEIDAGLAQLQVFCTAREEVAFATACQELARMVAAMGEAHALVWWNLL